MDIKAVKRAVRLFKKAKTFDRPGFSVNENRYANDLVALISTFKTDEIAEYVKRTEAK